MGKSIRDVRVIEALIIPTKWDTANVDTALKRLPIPAKTINLFFNNNVIKE